MMCIWAKVQVTAVTSCTPSLPIVNHNSRIRFGSPAIPHYPHILGDNLETFSSQKPCKEEKTKHRIYDYILPRNLVKRRRTKKRVKNESS